MAAPATIRCGAGNDVLDGGDGADNLFGGTGSDTLVASGGDTVDGGEDNNDRDVLRVAAGGTIACAQGTTDAGTVTWADGTRVVFSGIEQIDVEGVVDGTGSDDVMGAGYTGAQGDQINGRDGGAGDDTLLAGPGSDTLTGGAGADVFPIHKGDGTVRIICFGMTLSDGRTVDRFVVFALTNGNGDPLAWRDVTVADTNGDGTGDAVLTFANGETVVMEGVSPDQVSGKQNMAQIGIPCFVAGTPILTPSATRAV